MANLLNDFTLGSFTDAEAGNQSNIIDWVAGEEDPISMFLSLFGSASYSATCASATSISCFEPTDNRNLSGAFFGSDLDEDGIFKVARLVDDATYRTSMTTRVSYQGIAAIEGDFYYLNSRSPSTGVALVRDIQKQPVASVSEPGTVGLISLALIGLWGSRRRKLLD